MKLGKLAPKRHLKIPALGDYLDKSSTWPSVPPQGWEFAVPAADLSILGNDQYGDCGEAGALHLLQAQSFNVGRPCNPTTEDALAFYSAVTGFNPADPNSDQGTVLTDMLAKWKADGLNIGTANHKILGYASLDISSLAQIRYAIYTFGGALLGLNLPARCEQDTDNWNFGPGESIAGGHCVIAAGEGSQGIKIGSWGMWIPASNEFLAAYLDEAYIIVSEDFVRAADGKSPTGLDLPGLLSAMAKL